MFPKKTGALEDQNDRNSLTAKKEQSAGPFGRAEADLQMDRQHHDDPNRNFNQTRFSAGSGGIIEGSNES